jgi:predicted O-methyltransferase YrrM
MNEPRWNAVDEYFERTLGLSDPVLTATLARCRDAGLPPHDVAPNQGKLLQLFARMTGARRILEIGTLGGYSAICMARALPEDGTLVSLEADRHHAEVADANIRHAGLQARVRIVVGDAAATLARLREDGEPAFDLVFIDADKANNAVYLQGALALSRKGTVIIGDNIIRAGRIADAQAQGDADVRGVHDFFDLMARTPGLESTALQTVGCKGWDGFSLAVVD